MKLNHGKKKKNRKNSNFKPCAGLSAVSSAVGCSGYNVKTKKSFSIVIVSRSNKIQRTCRIHYLLVKIFLLDITP